MLLIVIHCFVHQKVNRQIQCLTRALTFKYFEFGRNYYKIKLALSRLVLGKTVRLQKILKLVSRPFESGILLLFKKIIFIDFAFA